MKARCMAKSTALIRNSYQVHTPQVVKLAAAPGVQPYKSSFHLTFKKHWINYLQQNTSTCSLLEGDLKNPKGLLKYYFIRSVFYLKPPDPKPTIQSKGQTSTLVCLFAALCCLVLGTIYFRNKSSCRLFTFTKTFWITASEAADDIAVTLMGISPSCFGLIGN